jgi:hypothetical protein
MAGLVPAIHVFVSGSKKDVDARDKPGHDGDNDCRLSRLVVRRAHYLTTAAVCPNNTLRSSSVRFTGWPKFGLISLAMA